MISSERERKLAISLLRAKEKGYPSPIVSLIGATRLHLFRYIVMSLLGLYLYMNWQDANERGILLCLAGFIAGGIIKEMAFIKKVKDGWPFTKKVTNWDAVAELAKPDSEPDFPDASGSSSSAEPH